MTFKVIQGHWKLRVRDSTYDFVLVVRCNYVCILHRFL